MPRGLIQRLASYNRLVNNIILHIFNDDMSRSAPWQIGTKAGPFIKSVSVLKIIAESMVKINLKDTVSTCSWAWKMSGTRAVKCLGDGLCASSKCRSDTRARLTWCVQRARACTCALSLSKMKPGSPEGAGSIQNRMVHYYQEAMRKVLKAWTGWYKVNSRFQLA